MTQMNVDLFKKAWLSFEEISIIDKNLKDFEKDGISTDSDEAFERINKSVFSKYAVQNV